ncbi:MAG: hypothetical protein GWO00_25370, partial [Gemmatimonadetes bacterium]|nr:hypothetical protein [Gemmatimonadota bacterium]NIT90395.1 hypothetical protein [Gemmatimonadota bacterium]NIU34223.1 hypothetical protein [Gemmatimonadota bacterium]NIV64541.1 hypothetical protein [Gemmatimonadota bacterium]NIW67294.1 hypothetical protein [Gemmatimonadota bacterium]
MHRTWLEEGRTYGDEVGSRLRRAMEVTLDDYLEASSWRARVHQRAAEAFRSV